MNNYLEKSKHSDDEVFSDLSEIEDSNKENLETVEDIETLEQQGEASHIPMRHEEVSSTEDSNIILPEEKLKTIESKFFAIRTTGGQERVVANILQNKVAAKKIGIYSILVLDSFKGYIIIEAPDSMVAFEALSGVRHVRGQIRGELPFKDIEGYIVKKPVVAELSVDDTVEVIGGPFKSMKAKITRVDYEKQEATVVLLDSPYQIPVTVDANYLKKSSR
ncbi:MAG: transcription elongation factor Spt5 [Nitrososphaeraceae archaeon]